MPKKGVKVLATQPLTVDTFINFGQVADLGAAEFIIRTSSTFNFRQGFDHLPGQDGGEYFVEFLFLGTGFAYLGSESPPIDGTIKTIHVFIGDGDAAAYSVSKLSIEVTPQLLEQIFGGDTVNFFAMLEQAPQLFAGDDRVVGSAFDDTISTYKGNDKIFPGAGGGTVDAGKDDDECIMDLIEGNLGAVAIEVAMGKGDDKVRVDATALDFFAFDPAFSGGVRVAVWEDFNGKHDTIVLSGFTGLMESKGHLDKGQFFSFENGLPPASVGLGPVILLDEQSGQVFFDIDGDGSKLPVQFLQFGGGVRVAAADFDLQN